MKLKINYEKEIIIRVLMIILFCSFTVLSTYTWGRYLMLGCLAFIFILDASQQHFMYKITISRFVLTVAFFAFYALISSLWATDAADAISKARTLFELLLMIFVVEHYYREHKDPLAELFLVIKWSSFIVVIYSFLFYGMETLIAIAAAEERMENEYANINTIGMLAAVGVVIQLEELIRKKRWSWSAAFCIPSVFLLALTQSRKALLIFLIGFFMVFFLHNTVDKELKKKVVKICFATLVAVGFVYLLLSLPVFEGTMIRMKTMLASFTGVGLVDSSTILRHQLTAIGWQQFIKTPVLGVGIGNPHHLALMHLRRDAYLHNNFIELLAGGGLVGFAIYYSMYAYLFVTFWRQRKNKNVYFTLCFTIMTILFFMDYGWVSYYSKINYMYLLLYFLEAEALKKGSFDATSGSVVSL